MRLPPVWLLFLLAVGCGGSEPAGEAGGPEAEACGAGEEEAADEAAAPSTAEPSATIRGVVKFQGKPPRRRRLTMGAETYCKENRPGELRDESVVVNDNSTLRSVFVWIRKGVRGKFPPPAEPVVIDQRFCQYVPHVVGVQAGQKLIVRNGDPIMHNVHAVSKYKSHEFNLAQTKKGMAYEKVFRRNDVVEVKCDVHGWMGAYVGVVKHPFFAVTGEDGAFELGRLPPGTYTAQAWHEVYGTKDETVTVGADETREIVFTFSQR
ncbi:MAG: hypothetical protein ACE5JG_01175 [Planctomycetota bacterium]